MKTTWVVDGGIGEHTLLHAERPGRERERERERERPERERERPERERDLRCSLGWGGREGLMERDLHDRENVVVAAAAVVVVATAARCRYLQLAAWRGFPLLTT